MGLVGAVTAATALSFNVHNYSYRRLIPAVYTIYLLLAYYIRRSVINIIYMFTVRPMTSFERSPLIRCAARPGPPLWPSLSQVLLRFYKHPRLRGAMASVMLR